MKYKNLTLITLNNTLHIKADNLEAVEFDLTSASAIMVQNLGYTIFESKQHKANILLKLEKGIPLPQELSDRIEVKHHWLDSCGDKQKAFLLPEKEEGSTMVNGVPQWLTDPTKVKAEITFVKSYSIEEIEKAIDAIGFYFVTKEEIINNLKK